MELLEKRYIEAKRTLFDKYYSSLNEKQRKAIFTVKAPLLILAGAGSGKTTVLVKRIAFIIRYGNAYFSEYVPYGISEQKVASLENAAKLTNEEIEPILDEFANSPCPPWQILAITFTNKAANEIKARLNAAFDDESVKDIWAGTFHSICMRILRANCDLVGYKAGFTIYDTDDVKKAVGSAMKRCNIDEKGLPIKSVINAISRAKDKLQTPQDMAAEAGKDATDFRKKQIAKVYASYQKQLKESNAMDFDDIIMQTVFLLRDNKDVRERYQQRFRYVCVDEFQDTNEAQFALTAMLAGAYQNIMVVGDEDQSIYKFRGATIANILNFDKTYSDANVIKLEQNYRSTQNILNAANKVISNNTGRKGKTLWTSCGDGEKLILRKLETQNEEARFVVDEVVDGVSKQGRKYKDYAVLYRANAQSNSIERAFAKSGVPYRMLGGTRFTDRKEIRDVVAYLQLINNHADRERLLRIINEPSRKIGEKTILAVEQIAAEQGITMFEVIEHADEYVALSRSSRSLLEFASLINSLTADMSDMQLDDFVNEVVDRSGYRQMLIDAGKEEQDRLENIEEFVSGVIEYMNSAEAPTLTEFLEETALVADVDRYDDSADAVVMMTIHSAKGLEFPIVFLPGMEDGIFPGMQTVMSMQSDDMEEERRLAYVAITRAKEKLYLLHTSNRLMYGRTAANPLSRFVEEIPPELIDRQSFGNTQYRSSAVKTYYTEKPKYQDKITVNKPLFSNPVKSVNKERFNEGDRVKHPMFGEGDIISVKQMGADILYEIVFDRAGTKKLMATYAKLTKI